MKIVSISNYKQILISNLTKFFHFYIRKNDNILSTKFNDMIILNVKIKEKNNDYQRNNKLLIKNRLILIRFY